MSSGSIRQANQRALAEYLVALPAQFSAYRGINPFWREITEPFRTRFDPPRDANTAEASAAHILAQIDAMPKTGYFVQPLSAEQCDAAWRKILTDMADPPSLVEHKARYEAAIVARFLEHRGILDDAQRTLRAMRMEPKYVTLRHFYYFTQLRDALGDRPIELLEIGAGGSTLKLFLKQHFGDRVRTYCIIDLPEMLCLSAMASIEFFPDEAIDFQIEHNTASAHTCANLFVPAHLVERLAACRFNCFVNTHSFQEMDPAVIGDYFDLIYRTACDGAVFFQTNLVQKRMSRLNGSTFNNHPARYPFRPADDILYSGEDPFHVYAREMFKYKPYARTLTSIRRIGSDRAPPGIWRKVANRLRCL